MSEPLVIYRCYFLGDDGKIKCAEEIECLTDSAALEEAESRLADCEYPAIEVWARARRVGIVGGAKDGAEIAPQGLEGGIDVAHP